MLVDKYVAEIAQEIIELCLEEFLKTDCYEEKALLRNLKSWK